MAETIQNVRVQFLRGNTADNDAYVGRAGEITIDELGKTLRVHNGTVAGGFFQVGAGGSADVLTINDTIDLGSIPL